MGLLTEAHGRGVFASRPAAGHAGREYYSTDTLVTYRDNGSTWDAQSTAGYTPGGTDVAVADGGTGASTASGARTNLGLVLGTDVASLTAGVVPIAQLATGTPSGAKFIRDDGTLQVPAGGGGGVAQSFVGYNTIGGTWTAMTSNKIYLKKVTLAATSTFQSIDAHIRGNTDATTGILALILSDAAGVPDLLIAACTVGTGSFYFSASASQPTTGRWFSMPIGATVAAGDYWIGVQAYASVLDLANDGSGSDVFFTTGAAYVSGSHSSFAKTTGTVKNSVRASILS